MSENVEFGYGNIIEAEERRYNCRKPESKSLKLIFLKGVGDSVYTGIHIGGGADPEIALIDIPTGNVVKSGSEASAKVRFFVLKESFSKDDDDRGDWTPKEFEEFEKSIVPGRASLLGKSREIQLKEGLASLKGISFSHTKNPLPNIYVRLVATVVDSSGGISIRAALSNPFLVKDRRVLYNKKHHPPSLADEVWRLEKIGKKGAFHTRLSKERVISVQDFLTLYYLDPTRLRNILGPGMSAKMWEVTVNHARTCVLDKKFCIYHPSRSQQKKGVVFSIVGQVMGVLSDYRYISSEMLSETEKGDARDMVISAFKNWHEVTTVDDEPSIITDFSSGLSNADDSSNTTMLSNSDSSKLLTSHKNEMCDYPEPSTSSPDIIPSTYSLGTMTGLDDYGLQRNKKDRRISCNDEVWRFEYSGEDGPSHKKLRKENINTVEHFLAMDKGDPVKLQNILEETMTPLKLEATINHHPQKCEDNMKSHLPFSPAPQQNACTVLMNIEEGGLEAKHINATGKVSNACEDEVSGMPVAAFKNTGEDTVDGASSYPILSSDSKAEFSPLFNKLGHECTIGAFWEEEYRWYLHDRNIITRAENEQQQYFDHIDLSQSMFGPPAYHMWSETLVCDGRVRIRWKLLWSILRWLSIRRNVARTLELLQGYKGVFFHNDLNATKASKAQQVG